MNEIIKEKAYTIRGIAIILIILCHTQTFIAKYCHADLAVSMFFFFSGYFIMNNYLTKNNYLNKSFLNRKLCNIYIPFIISNIFYILTYFIINNNVCFNSIFDLILKVLGIIPINGNLWFIVHILIYYIVFYLFCHKRKIVDIKYYIIVYITYLAIIIGIPVIFKIWGGYDPIEHILLLVGATCSIYNNKIKMEIFSSRKKYILCIIFLVLFVYNIYFTNIITTQILQLIVPFFLLLIIKFNKILDFIGKNSLLIYLYHIQIIMILNNYISKKNELIYILLFLLINILLIVIWKFIEKYVYNKFTKDKARR